jgi:hypothetical protein
LIGFVHTSPARGNVTMVGMEEGQEGARAFPGKGILAQDTFNISGCKSVCLMRGLKASLKRGEMAA